MRRLLTILLTTVVLFSGLAQAFDLHEQTGCADSSNTSPFDSGSPARGDVPDAHASGCCFGSMGLTLPASSFVLPVTTIKIANGADTARPPSWYSDSPERPPRS